MRTSLATATIVLVVLLAGPSTGAPDPGIATSLDPAVQVLSGSASERQAMAEAVARFREAGLALPDLTVRFHDDEGPCGGYRGRFHVEDWRVLICSDLPFVPTHELAHAYTAAHLDDAARARFVAASGALAWNDGDIGWNDRGVEQAAFVIQQVLMAADGVDLNATWQERIALYELVTGRPVPDCVLGSHPDTCEAK